MERIVMCNRQQPDTTDDLEIFNEITNTKSSDIDELDSLPWKRYGAYKLLQYIKRFFSYKPKPSRELNLEDTVGNLLSPFSESGATIPEEILNKCKELLQHQRMLEDTRARRRLEHWATKIISYYLIIVFIILLLSGFASVINIMLCQFCGIDSKFIISTDSVFLSDKVLVVLLSTTTINIIGLGLIVLRGHFGNKEDKKDTNN
nr:MAG TPA: hypothetical protein [Caudoviricetes sp.]DAZ04572.1 MAG TPA: hypothetical protein [Caudoviricetes sp.]